MTVPVRDVELTEQITEVHARSRGTYGVPRGHAVLTREGAGCGRRRVVRLTRAAGLQGCRAGTVDDGKRLRSPTSGLLCAPTSLPGTSSSTAPGSTPAGAATSHTSRPARAGSVWPRSSASPPGAWPAGTTADHLRTDLVADALASAGRQRRPARPAIFHSDRGSHFADLAAATPCFQKRRAACREIPNWIWRRHCSLVPGSAKPLTPGPGSLHAVDRRVRSRPPGPVRRTGLRAAQIGRALGWMNLVEQPGSRRP
ncbi:IS3 family transposase [Streptomyces sp. SID3915]|nr:IS3 family transposase [Streptomyces sp. SID3915]